MRASRFTSTGTSAFYRCLTRSSALVYLYLHVAGLGRYVPLTVDWAHGGTGNQNNNIIHESQRQRGVWSVLSWGPVHTMCTQRMALSTVYTCSRLVCVQPNPAGLSDTRGQNPKSKLVDALESMARPPGHGVEAWWGSAQSTGRKPI